LKNLVILRWRKLDYCKVEKTKNSTYYPSKKFVALQSLYTFLIQSIRCYSTIVLLHVKQWFKTQASQLLIFYSKRWLDGNWQTNLGIKMKFVSKRLKNIQV